MLCTLLSGLLLAKHRKTRSVRDLSKPETEADELDQQAGPQLYEEIRDVPTEAAGTPEVTTSVPQYEDVNLPSEKASEYQITQCSAYGVSVNS